MPNKLQQEHLKNDFYQRVRKKYLQRLSRFYGFRQAYSLLQNKLQSLNPTVYKNCLKIRDQSIFTDIAVEKAVADMRDCGVAFDLQITPDLVKEIDDFARITPCKEPGFNDEFFADDVKNGRLQKCERRVMRGLVNNVRDCQAIKAIIHDPLLLEIVHQYLQYWPTMITQHLTWSFASDLPESEIQKSYPPTNFHYDIAGYNFMTSYFYITDVDIDSGPHIMIKNSHKQKPLHMLLASNCQADDAMLDQYGRENQIVITGKKGFGFVQDPSCFHKVKAPVISNRLLLQIRYS
ncbi:MAG: hypothetical protein EA343_14645 [Nodularia sp. (in: Bacteria)]|nr:MAG: hypothetical protein EA343_14645 [Nodularia sp. (in: cyanobacteria)]